MNIEISNEQIEQMIKKAVIEEVEEKAYNRGLAEAWDAARKIHDGQIPYEVFGLDKTGNGFTYASPLNWGETITAQEAIAKIKTYEDKQNNHKEIMDFCENMGYSLDELAEVLKEMRGDENDE